MPMIRRIPGFAIALLFATAGTVPAQVGTTDTRLLSQPAASANGRWIPQLDRAVAWVMEELRKNPPATLKRPVFRDKTKAP